jgi:putative tricarboxylic transport membrane protein
MWGSPNSLVVTPSTEAGGRPRAPARPWWLGLGLIAFGGVWLYGALSLAQTAQYAVIGPGLMVTLVGAGLIALGALLLLQIAGGEEFSPQDTEDAMANAPADRVAFFTATAAAALPIVLTKPLGFPLSAALSFALVARAFGSRRLLLDLVIGAALGTIAFLGFERLGINLGDFFPPLPD